MKERSRACLASMIGAAMLLMGCSPALNWRVVQLKDAPLQLALPCEPQAATRPVAMGGEQVQLSVLGCEAQGATYTVSHFFWSDPLAAAQVLGYWQQAVRQQLSVAADTTGAATQDLQLSPRDGPWLSPKALNVPQSQRLTWSGVGEQGRGMTVHGLWFARLEGSGVRLYQLMVYAAQSRESEADWFFQGLQLQ